MSALFAPAILGTGLVLGLVHALDPDHLLTVSSLAARPGRHGATLRYAGSWALGHGALLVAVVAAALLLGWALPTVIASGAERLVGGVLIITGVVVLRDLPTASRIGLSGTDNGPVLAFRLKAPFAIGVVPGTAGSAALLALLPASPLSPAIGMTYALVFALGTLLGMMSFGLMFERIQAIADARRPELLEPMQALLGVMAIGLGALWLWRA